MNKNYFFCYFVTICMIVFGFSGITGCVSAPVYNGPVSDHFDGKRFVNRLSTEKSLWDMISIAPELLLDDSWPDWVESEPQTLPPVSQKNNGISITFINHSTVLIRVDGVNILTDPIYSKRASPFTFMGPSRVRIPGIPFEDLPQIDLILISHNHYDHLDIPTLQRLQKINPGKKPPLILSGLGNGKLYSEEEIPNFKDLDWGDSKKFGDVEIIFSESRHRSGRGMTDQKQTLWGAFVIKTSFGNIYFCGDTGYGPHFKETREKYGPFKLSLVPIGAYEPRWFMKPVHLNPGEAVQAHLDLQSERSIGIHFGTFKLAKDKIDQPVQDLEKALKIKKISKEKFQILSFGETREYF